jgi:subtilisin family serine protease
MILNKYLTLIEWSSGNSNIVVAIIDGPVDASHPALSEADLHTLTSDPVACRLSNSLACQHGTFVTGILAANRESLAPSLCPHCTFIIRPIFCESIIPGQCPEVTPQHLADALTEVIDAGAKVVNMSLGIGNSSVKYHPILDDVFDYAAHKGTILIGAAGNQGYIGANPLFKHPWVIPVAACDVDGRPINTNLSATIGKQGLMAPGVGIVSTLPNGRYGKNSGTSVAAPFVTGVIALLWSMFPDATAQQIRRAILQPGQSRKSIVPPMLNADMSLRAIQQNA